MLLTGFISLLTDLLLSLYIIMLLYYYADDIIFSCQLEMKQRYLVGKMNVPDEKEGGHDEVTMETLGEDSS